MKKLSVLFALFFVCIPFSFAESDMSRFAEAYAAWKAENHMSAFPPEIDSQILQTVESGDCDFARFELFMRGMQQIPNAMTYRKREVVKYGDSVDRLADVCNEIKQK